MKSIIKAIFSSIVAILSKIAKFFLSIPSWLVSLFKTIGSFFMMCLLWVKRLLLSGWSFTKSLFAKARSIRKPSWFQWNIFPKDGQPPTQSLFEIAIYLVCLWFCVDLFIDFNKIPTSHIIIEADKYGNSRYISKDTIEYVDENDKSFYYHIMHFQVADIQLDIPMYSFGSPYDQKESRLSGFTYSSKKYYNCEMPEAWHGEYLTVDSMSNINPYWFCVFELAAKNSGYYSGFVESFSDQDYIEQIKINEYYQRLNGNLNECKELQEMLPDSLSNNMTNFYKFKFSTSYYKNNEKDNVKDTTWYKWVDNTSLFNFILYDENNNEILKCYEFGAIRAGNEQIDNQGFFYQQLYKSTNYTEKMWPDYVSLCSDADIDLWEIYQESHNFKAGVPFSFGILNSRFRNNLAASVPSIFDRHDISQGWYSFILDTSTLDSINLTINFGGATDFYPMKIEPDEIGSNYIKYTDQVKLLKIRAEGLTFYAKFKEMENIQTIRCFGVTALISGLIIIILTFFILGLYRTLKVFGNYLFKNRNIQ